MKTRLSDIEAYQTKDNSLIRELMHPALHHNQAQSLAEATIASGATTQLHRHRQSEEIYHVLEGQGEMQLGEEQFTITTGDTICIMPGTPHRVSNTGDVPLRILCSCAPAYRHEDTEIL